MNRRGQRTAALLCAVALASLLATRPARSTLEEEAALGIGREAGAEKRLADGEELALGARDLVEIGRQLFDARWTTVEGAGRPRAKGTGTALNDPGRPLDFPDNFNRLSGPDANGCSGCHHTPFGIVGGGGDIVANAFVAGGRFDRLDFVDDRRPLVSARDEHGRPVKLGDAANERATPGLFGAGYVEMLAREITAELQTRRDLLVPGGSTRLLAKGLDFGVLGRIVDGRFDVSGVRGLPPSSLTTFGADDPPTLIVEPFGRSAEVSSLREMTNNALVQHHGMQPTERFGVGADADGDGVSDEITRAEVTAMVMFQAAMPVPGRRVARHRRVEEAVLAGEVLFEQIGCAGCHVPRLPLTARGRRFVEPGPYNSDQRLRPGQSAERGVVRRNLRLGEATPVGLDLSDPDLPPPRLESSPEDLTWVPMYSDLQLHDITSGEGDPNREPLDLHRRPGSAAFFAGNGRFLTARLWGVGNQRPYFHHGRFTTLREAIEAHAGEAAESRAAFRRLSETRQAWVIEFLKSLQVLPPGTRSLVVDELGQPRGWPPEWAEQRRALLAKPEK